MGRIFTLRDPNTGRITGTREDDIVQSSRAHPNIINSRTGSTRLLAGDDIIRSTSKIKIFGEIGLGKGKDLITGGQLIQLYAVDNRNGNLYRGPGSDTVDVSNGQLRVGEDSTLDTASGNDRITAKEIVLILGGITTESGNDQIHAGKGGVAIVMDSINMGDGNDILNSEGEIRASEGTINMGKGNDSINAASTGLSLRYISIINLGPGNDRITGFATTPLPDDRSEPGLIQGGKGTDTLILPQGHYTITKPQPNANPFVVQGISQISGENSLLLVSGINRLEGVNGGEANYGFGTFLVDVNGIGSFIS